MDVSFQYKTFLLMDVLNLSKEQVKQMNWREYKRALSYSWLTYNLRRVDLPYRKQQPKNKEIIPFK